MAVPLEDSSVCLVDSMGKIVWEAKFLNEPEVLIAWISDSRERIDRIGLESRHFRTAFKTMPVTTDKKDPRGKAQQMRMD